MNVLNGPHAPARIWSTALLLALLTLALYLPILTMPFYAEDPLDLGQVRGSSLADILFTNASEVYYRPLTFLLMKAAELPDTTFNPLPFHAAHVVAHAVNVGLVFLFAWRLTRNHSTAMWAAALFSAYPYSYDAIARATPQQPFIITGLLLALLFYLKGRLSQSRKWLWASLLPLLITFPILENALLFGLAIAALETLLNLQRQVPRASLFPLVHILAAVPFAAAWLFIPKDGSGFRAVLDPRVGDLLIRSAVWPIASIIDADSRMQQIGLLGIVLSVAVFALAFWKGRAWAWLILPGTLWFIGSVPVWLITNYRYFEISPRVVYVSTPGLALAWAGLAAWPSSDRRMAGLWRVGINVLLGILVVHCLAGTLALQTMYRHGSQLMWEILQATAQAGTGRRLLFVDVPDRFTLKQTPWPFGWWGMLLAPVSVDLGQYSDLTSGIQPETRSLSAPALSAAERDAWPYHADTRGVTASPERLYADALWADAVYRTRFDPNGAMSLEWVGAVDRRSPDEAPIAEFADVAELLAVDLDIQQERISVKLLWRSIGSAHPNDTIFIHLYRLSELKAQADGDSLGGLLPLTQWQPGDVIEDVRTFDLPSDIDTGAYRVGIGIYNRVTGERLPAFGADNSALNDDMTMIDLFQSR